MRSEYFAFLLQKQNEKKELTKEEERLLSHVISSREKLKNNYLKYWYIESNWGKIEWVKLFFDKDKQERYEQILNNIDTDNVKIVPDSKKIITFKNWKTTNRYEIEIAWKIFVVIETPNVVLWRKFRNLRFFKGIVKWKDIPWWTNREEKEFYENYLSKEVLQQEISSTEFPYIIYAKEAEDLEIADLSLNPENINSKYWISSIKQGLMDGVKWPNIFYDAILLEMIFENEFIYNKYELDENWKEKSMSDSSRFIRRRWVDADSDSNLCIVVREFIDDIREVFWIDFGDYYDNPATLESEKTAYSGCIVTEKWRVSDYNIGCSWNARGKRWSLLGPISSIYFSNPEENNQVVKSIYSYLNSNGILVIDFLNVYKAIDELVPFEKRTAEGIEFTINRTVEDGMIKKSISFSDNGQNFQYEENVSILDFGYFDKVLKQEGFEIIEIFGDYDLARFDKNSSERLIIKAIKK